LLFKAQSLLNGISDVTIGQIGIEIHPRARGGSVVAVPSDQLGRDRVFMADPASQIDHGGQLGLVDLLNAVVPHDSNQSVAGGIVLGRCVTYELQRTALLYVPFLVDEEVIGNVNPPPHPARPALERSHARRRPAVEFGTIVMHGDPVQRVRYVSLGGVHGPPL